MTRSLIRRDLAEAAALLVVCVFLGVAVTVLGYAGVREALLGGATVGLFAARIRLQFVAERTDTGIVRRRTRAGESVAKALNGIEYPAVYDRYLAVLCLCVAAGAIVAIPVVEPSPRVTIYLVVTAVVGFVSAGAAYGLASIRAGKA
ncbi:hypothetical protein [Halobaculum litoreum]|uniref:Uncharacterized protein n=1 Tax=Halobaculum litoreum TaxID=3031998 RepID=A0ABD5XSY3_9EURY|nr:hypothetical protein [Halobaculum sp. DT92]